MLLKCLYQARKLGGLVHVYQGYRFSQCFLDLSMRFWNCSESGACLVFHFIIHVILLFNKFKKRYIMSTTTSTFITSQAYELIKVYLDNGPNFSHLRRHFQSTYIMYHTIRFEIWFSMLLSGWKCFKFQVATNCYENIDCRQSIIKHI